MNLSKYLTPLLIAPVLTFAQPVLAQKQEPDLGGDKREDTVGKSNQQEF